MRRSRTIQLIVATGLCAAATAAQSSLAGAEPKNTSPFTRPVTTGRLDANFSVAAPFTDRGSTAPTGEAKNQPPFTNRINIRRTFAVARSPRSETVLPSGEAKNQPPFTRH
jgi:hypothetical protein